MHPKAKLGAVAAGGGWAAPDPVTDLTATADAGGIVLAWTESFGATGYDIQRSLTNGSFADIASNQTGSSYDDESGDPSTLYYYRIIANRYSVPSQPSNVVSDTTP